MIGKELLNVPMGDMIKQMAFAIADAQIKLDANSIEVAQMMGGLRQVPGLDGRVAFEDSRVYFGKEKMTIDDAIEMHNSTNDRELKAVIREKLQGKFFEIDESTIEIKDNVAGTTITFIPTRVSMLELGFSPTFYQFVDTIIEVKIAITMASESEYSSSYDYTDTSSSSQSGSSSRSSNFSHSASGGFILGKVGYSSNSASSSSSNYSSSRVMTSSVNSTYSSKYSYSEEGSSLLRTKLVPIPPPAILEERIRANMEVAMEEKKSNVPNTNEN